MCIYLLVIQAIGLYSFYTHVNVNLFKIREESIYDTIILFFGRMFILKKIIN